MENIVSKDIKEQLQATYKQALDHTTNALDYMARFGIKPDGRFGLFLAPETRQKEIHTIPYNHTSKQQVIYETEAGEFSALCPFSGLPDFGVLRIEYVPVSSILELKSLKYYIQSWRNIGAAQEDITAFIFEDLRQILPDADSLIVTTVYNVRGGIRTTCSIDSSRQ